jgi:hypothetical protein
MNSWKTLFQEMWVRIAIALVILAAILGILANVFEVAAKTKEWTGELILAILIVVLLYSWSRDKTQVQSIEEKTTDEEINKGKKKDLRVEATGLLEQTYKSLYYFGGSGFIGDYQHWREELDKKLCKKEIKIVRLMDVKNPSEMRNLLQGVLPDNEIENEIKKYKEWLTTHAKRLKSRVENNYFYDFDGAPIWKYGTHYIVFDEKHLIVVFLTEGDRRKAIFIRNRPDIAAPLVKSIDYVVHVLKTKELSAQDLQNKIDM